MVPLVLAGMAAGAGFAEILPGLADPGSDQADSWSNYTEPGYGDPGQPEFACRLFPVSLEDGQGGYFETSDRTSPIGEWLGSMENMGWTVHSMDFEMGQRATGFPMAQVMVCVTRDR